VELPQKDSPASSPTLRVSIPISDLSAEANLFAKEVQLLEPVFWRRRFNHARESCEGDVTAEAIHCEAGSGFFAKSKKDFNC